VYMYVCVCANVCVDVCENVCSVCVNVKVCVCMLMFAWMYLKHRLQAFLLL
jgi:hypothetical protein